MAICNDAGIYQDDILIVDRSQKAIDKKIIIAIINGEFTVKRIRIKNKEIYLQPETTSYPLIRIDPSSEKYGVL